MRKTLCFVLICIMAIYATGCAPTSSLENTKSAENETILPTSAVSTYQTEIIPEVTVPPDTEAVQESLTNPFTPGMYKIGTDLPAGEYCFIAHEGKKGYVCVSSDSNKDDIIENENFKFSFFITVSEGQYLDVSRADFIGIDNNDYTLKIQDVGSIPEGMYRIGVDIPSGEYKLIANNGDRGYYCIYPNSQAPFDILSNDNFENTSYVTVKDGQYFVINRCVATLVS